MSVESDLIILSIQNSQSPEYVKSEFQMSIPNVYVKIPCIMVRGIYTCTVYKTGFEFFGICIVIRFQSSETDSLYRCNRFNDIVHHTVYCVVNVVILFKFLLLLVNSGFLLSTDGVLC